MPVPEPITAGLQIEANGDGGARDSESELAVAAAGPIRVDAGAGDLLLGSTALLERRLLPAEPDANAEAEDEKACSISESMSPSAPRPDTMPDKRECVRGDGAYTELVPAPFEGTTGHPFADPAAAAATARADSDPLGAPPAATRGDSFLSDRAGLNTAALEAVAAAAPLPLGVRGVRLSVR